MCSFTPAYHVALCCALKFSLRCACAYVCLFVWVASQVEDAADKLEEAQRAVAAAELGVIAAVVEAPTTLKLLKVLRLGLRMRQRAADYHFEHHSPYSSPPRGYTTPQRAEVVGMERQKSGRFRHSSFRGGDDDEDDERGNSGNHHKHHHKDHHHHKHRHGKEVHIRTASREKKMEIKRNYITFWDHLVLE